MRRVGGEERIARGVIAVVFDVDLDAGLYPVAGARVLIAVVGIGIEGDDRDEVDLESRFPECDLDDAPAGVVEVLGALLRIRGFEELLDQLQKVGKVETLRFVDVEVDADVGVYGLAGAGAVARTLLK
jgi:hypothetical protein